MGFVSIVVLLIAGICAYTDVRRRKVYNIVTFPAMLAGLAYHSFLDGFSGFQGSVVGLIFGLLIIILPFLLGGTGAGDSKLLGALGAWMCLPDIVYVFVIAGLGAGAVSLAVFLFRNAHLLRHPVLAVASLNFGISPSRQADDEGVKLPKVVKHTATIPFALLVAIGVVVVVLIQL